VYNPRNFIDNHLPMNAQLNGKTSANLREKETPNIKQNRALYNPIQRRRIKNTKLSITLLVVVRFSACNFNGDRTKEWRQRTKPPKRKSDVLTPVRAHLASSLYLSIWYVNI
jgi:hypothetical protein